MNPLLSVATVTAAIVVGTSLFQPAHASLIILNTRFSNTGLLTTEADYQSTIDGLILSTPTAGYCDQTLVVYDNTRFSTFGPEPEIEVVGDELAGEF